MLIDKFIREAHNHSPEKDYLSFISLLRSKFWFLLLLFFKLCGSVFGLLVHIKCNQDFERHQCDDKNVDGTTFLKFIF